MTRWGFLGCEFATIQHTSTVDGTASQPAFLAASPALLRQNMEVPESERSNRLSLPNSSNAQSLALPLDD
jgi:hypothetical protein